MLNTQNSVNMDNLNEKYKEIVKQGRELFWKYGIKKVTVEEICQKAGTSRVTFYKYFQNKEGLALHILKKLTDESMKEYHEIMESDDVYEEKVRKLILMKIRGSDHLSHELLKDLYSGEFPEIMKLLMTLSTESLQMIEKDFRDARERGDIRKDVKIEFIMYMLAKMQDLINDPGLENIYPDSGEAISEMIRFFFYGILPKNNN